MSCDQMGWLVNDVRNGLSAAPGSWDSPGVFLGLLMAKGPPLCQRGEQLQC